jgi:hypothetical protein
MVAQQFPPYSMLTLDDGHIGRNIQYHVKELLRTFTDKRIACRTVELVTFAK